MDATISDSKCGALRWNCGRIMHIRFSRFFTDSSHRSGVNHSLSFVALSHAVFISFKFPFVHKYFSSCAVIASAAAADAAAVLFHHIIYSSATLRTYTQRVIFIEIRAVMCVFRLHSVWPKNLPHAFYTRNLLYTCFIHSFSLFSVGIFHEHLHNHEMFDVCRIRATLKRIQAKFYRVCCLYLQRVERANMRFWCLCVCFYVFESVYI